MNIIPITTSIEANNAINQIHSELKSRSFLDSMKYNAMVDDTKDFLNENDEAFRTEQETTMEEFLNNAVTANN